MHRFFHIKYLEKVQGCDATKVYRKAMRKCQVWVELLAEAKLWHSLRLFRLRGLDNVNTEALLIAARQNIKRLLAASLLGPTLHPVWEPGGSPERAAMALSWHLALTHPTGDRGAGEPERAPTAVPVAGDFFNILGRYRNHGVGDSALALLPARLLIVER